MLEIVAFLLKIPINLTIRGNMKTSISAIDFGNLQPLEIFVAFVIMFVACALLIFAVKSFLATRKAKTSSEGEEIVAPSEDVQMASGSCGELKLVNTDDRSAAMIMAIIADQTEIPLNELRFISIEKKKEDVK